MGTFSALTEKQQTQILATFPFAGKEWAPRSLRGITGWACRWLDLLVLESVFLATVILHYFLQSQITFAQFFALRISLRNLVVAGACFLAWRGVLRGMGLYDLARIQTLDGYIIRCVAAVTACTAVVALVELVIKHEPHIFLIASTYWIVCLSIMVGGRALLLYRDLDYSLVGYVDSDPQRGYVSEEQVLGTIDDLESILMHRVVDEVVIALPMKSQYQIIGETIATCEQLGIASQYFTDHFGTRVTKNRRSVGHATGRMILETVHWDSRRHLKRLIDFSAALIGMIVLSPILLATAIAVKLTSPGPIIFRQQRFGFNKRTFPMFKFRSMVIDAEARQARLEHLNETSGPAFKIANDPRITPIGKFIRKMSIDELPQLVNVLLGDMSLVGPRPLPTRDVSRFSEAWLMRRFSVKPGLTCLWQVTGRSNTDFDRWVELDLKYIDNWSLTLDFEILVKTIPAVLKGRGAS
jgi:lipopolysaccharide/colanic/teichoic acid biosynthesis glycosyltransferase